MRVPVTVRAYREEVVPVLQETREKILLLWEVQPELNGLLNGSDRLAKHGNYTSVLRFIESDAESPHPTHRAFEYLVRDLEILASPDILGSAGAFGDDSRRAESRHHGHGDMLISNTHGQDHLFAELHPTKDFVRNIFQEAVQGLGELEKKHAGTSTGQTIASLRDLVQDKLLSDRSVEVIGGFLDENPAHLQAICLQTERQLAPSSHARWRNTAAADYTMTGWKI